MNNKTYVPDSFLYTLDRNLESLRFHISEISNVSDTTKAESLLWDLKNEIQSCLGVK